MIYLFATPLNIPVLFLGESPSFKPSFITVHRLPLFLRIQLELRTVLAADQIKIASRPFESFALKEEWSSPKISTPSWPTG